MKRPLDVAIGSYPAASRMEHQATAARDGVALEGNTTPFNLTLKFLRRWPCSDAVSRAIAHCLLRRSRQKPATRHVMLGSVAVNLPHQVCRQRDVQAHALGVDL